MKGGSVIIYNNHVQKMITKIPDGTLVRGSDSAVFLIEHGKKRPVMDSASFYFYKLMAKKIIPLEDMLLRLYPLGEGVTASGPWAKCAPATVFVKGGGSGIFLWMDNCLFPIQTGEVFRRLRCQMDEIVHVPDSLIHSLPVGHSINASFFLQYPVLNGRLYSSTSGHIYYGERRTLRKVEGPLVFSYFQWSVDQLIYLTHNEFIKSPIGKPVLS
ncbi:hypothetical protein [Paenibacillus sp. MDMC362]|uniref:hypothetical protein n=1 Tax=Paenibacillus sp. MDMC362 TaxID=2977365 RepID=UPI000DC2BD9D|nr:hypothetical protein [Paenibacillus sp. MDMC362]RAR44573.1 hypothetical protein DP091_07295 [Paenibacillus sp. MDMC362]